MELMWKWCDCGFSEDVKVVWFGLVIDVHAKSIGQRKTALGTPPFCFLPHASLDITVASSSCSFDCFDWTFASGVRECCSTMDRYLVHSTAPTGNTAEHVAHAQPAQLAGSKRKSTDAPPTIHLDDFDVSEGQVMDSCTVVRGKIKRFLDSGEMRIGQFCDAIGVSQNAYRRFMAEKGQYGGMGCDTYQSAWEFFRKREMAGLKIPTKKQKTAAAAKAGASAASAKSSTMVGKKDAVTDISSVHLEGNYDAESGVFCAWLTMV